MFITARIIARNFLIKKKTTRRVQNHLNQHFSFLSAIFKWHHSRSSIPARPNNSLFQRFFTSENFWRKTFFCSSTIDFACCCHFLFFGNKNFFSARRAKFHVITRVWNGSFSKPWYLHLPRTFHAKRPECGGVNITCQFTLLSKTWKHEEDANFLSENNLPFFFFSLLLSSE